MSEKTNRDRQWKLNPAHFLDNANTRLFVKLEDTLERERFLKTLLEQEKRSTREWEIYALRLETEALAAGLDLPEGRP